MLEGGRTALWRQGARIRKRILTARASRAGDGVLGLGFRAVAFQSGLLATATLGLRGADAGFLGAATAGAWDCHGDLSERDVGGVG